MDGTRSPETLFYCVEQLYHLSYQSISKASKMQVGNISRLRGINKIREFKICDAKVTKTSFKIASSGLLIFFVMSACLTSKNYCNSPGTELGGAVLNLR